MSKSIPELLKIATNELHEENRKEKHEKNAKYGWYSYDSRFALPVFGENGEIERYNVFHVAMLVRHAQDGKMYLYDIMNIKKKRASFSSPRTLLSNKTHFLNKILSSEVLKVKKKETSNLLESENFTQQKTIS